MSDKERYKNDQNDENNDSSSTTTTTVNSNRAISSILNSDTNQQQKVAQIKQKKKVASSPKSSMEHNISRFQIQHLSDDHDFDDEFTDEYYNGAMVRQSVRIDDLDARGIIEYFDETELKPTSSGMFMDLGSHKVAEKPALKSDSRDSNDMIDQKLNRISSLNGKKNSTKPISPIMLLRRESMKRSSQRSKSSKESKRISRNESVRIQAEKSDQDLTEPEQPDSDKEYKKNLKNKKHHFLSADHLYNKRLVKQKEKELEDAHQKKIKNLSKQQIQEQLNQHQYPHPTQHQRNMQQKHLTLMFTPENERQNLYTRSLSLSTNLQTPSGYIIDPNEEFDLWGRILIILSYFFLIVSFPFSLCTCLKIAQEYERAVIFRLGRILKSGEKGPGIFFVLPCIDTYTKVDLRTVTFDVPPQEILTRDSVTISVDAVVYFRIFNAVISVINIEDAPKSTKLLAASTLRNTLGTKSLHEILSDRESIAMLIQSSLDETTEPWESKWKELR